ncbi:hypothetical protein S40288_06827 [Stachybotrys chartarum IBT 40288]|nr:hypothetical protein S40288_06827 [Stachybotrys chartarum IBT 40288]
MSSSKLIVVLGATGNQGGSIVDVFLEDPGWRVRGITRNPSGGKARALVARGAEVVHADLDNPATLAPAFEGATVIFAVSDFWGIYADPTNKDQPKPGQPLNLWAAHHETHQLIGLVDAASKVPTLERFILSSLSSPTKWSEGKYSHVYHFDSKAEAEDYARESHPSLWAKTSVFQAGYFLSNFVSNPITKPQRASNGIIQFIGNLDPDNKLPWLAAEEDTGPLVKALLEEPAGKNLIGYRAWLSPKELADAFTKATGMKSEAIMLPKGQSHLPLPPELAEELDDNWSYWNEFGYYGGDPTVIHPESVH